MVKEVGHRAVPRHDEGRIELHERLECECALVQPGVRQRQSRRASVRSSTSSRSRSTVRGP